MAGRPGKYKTHVKPHFEDIKYMIGQGMTEEQVAKKLGIGYRTFNEYKSKYSELKQALKKGKTDLVYELEQSLFTKARGRFTTKKITRKYIEDEKGCRVGGSEVTETITEHAPDLGALVFTLKNIASDKWKDKVEHGIDGGKEMSDAVKRFLGVS